VQKPVVTKSINNHKNYILVIVLISVLCFCIAVGGTFAWLYIHYTRPSKGIETGEVQLEIYNGNINITNNRSGSSSEIVNASSNPLNLAGGSTTRTIDLKVRNTGNIDGLLRVSLIIYYVDDGGEQSQVILDTDGTLDGDNKVNITFGNNWVYNFPLSTNSVSGGVTTSNPGDVVAGYMYYNTRIIPYEYREVTNNDVVSSTNSDNDVVIISSITVCDALKDKDLKVSILADICPYSGNIYEKLYDSQKSYELGSDEYPVEAYPFGKLGDDETGFLQYWTAWKEANK